MTSTARLLDRHAPVAPRAAAPRRVSLRRNFSWTMAGIIAFAGSQCAALVVLGRLGGLETVGRFTLGLTVAMPIFAFTNLQLRGVQAVDVQRDYAFGHYLAVRLVMTALALLAVALAALGAGYGGAVVQVILAVGLLKAVQAIIEIYYGLLQQHERMRDVSISLLLRSPLAVLALTVAFYYTGNLALAVLAMAVASLVVLAAYDMPMAARVLRSDGAGSPLQRHLPRFAWRRLARLGWLALPLALLKLQMALGVSIPRYYVERRLGEAELGAFGAIAYITVAGTLVMTAMGHTAAPRLARYFAAGQRRALQRLTAKLVAFGFLLGGAVVVAAWFVGASLLTLMYGRDFAPFTGVLLVMMLAGGVSYMNGLMYQALVAMRRFRTVTLFQTVHLLIVVAFSASWIGRWGLMGAAWVGLAGVLFVLVAEAIATVLAIRQVEPAPAAPA